ncbi:MAG: MATE family efflux transporter [Candidatus Krumholzibacteria bacterium]|nr:MATE family efflux transporter [Candidatus Krumholzibacteria bacterium]
MISSFRSILRTSVPIVFDLGAQILMWTVETTLVGHISIAAMQRLYPGLGATGVDALTAVGNVVQVIIYTCTILLIFVFGATIIITRLLGAGRRDDADHFLGQTLFTALFPAVGIAIIWYFFAPFIFRTVLGAHPAVTAIGVDYLRVLSLFAPLVIMNFVAIGIVRGAGDTHLSMLTSLIVNGIHLVGAVALVYGLGPFPQLGPRGAALSAGVGHTAGFLFTYAVILRGRSLLTFNWSDFRQISRPSIAHIIRTGAPITLEQLAWMTGMTVVIGFTNRLGPVAAASHIVILTFQRIFSIVYQAFGMAALTLVGKRYGALEYVRARLTTRMFAMMLCGGVLFLAALIYLRARYFVIVFTTDPEVIELCTSVLRIMALVQIPKALSYVYSFSLRGIGENRYPMYLAFIGVLAFQIALGYNLAFTFGLSLAGVWIAAGVDEAFKFSLAMRRFRRRVRTLIARAA